MVKLSLENNVTIQLRFDVLTCYAFANIIQASAHVTFQTPFLLVSRLQTLSLFLELGKGSGTEP